MLQIVFTRSTSWVSRLISWCIGGRATHVGLVLPGGRYLHADASGVVVTDRDGFLGGDRVVVALFEASQRVEQLFDQTAALDFVGSRYDFDGALGYLPVLFFRHFFGREIRNPFADEGEFVCSSFVADPRLWQKWHTISEFSGAAATLDPTTLLRRIQTGRSFVPVVIARRSKDQ